MNEVPFLGEIGYVAPTKSINWVALLGSLFMIGVIVFAIYQLFFSDESDEKRKE